MAAENTSYSKYEAAIAHARDDNGNIIKCGSVHHCKLCGHGPMSVAAARVHAQQFHPSAIKGCGPTTSGKRPREAAAPADRHGAGGAASVPPAQQRRLQNDGVFAGQDQRSDSNDGAGGLARERDGSQRDGSQPHSEGTFVTAESDGGADLDDDGNYFQPEEEDTGVLDQDEEEAAEEQRRAAGADGDDGAPDAAFAPQADGVEEPCGLGVVDDGLFHEITEGGCTAALYLSEFITTTLGKANATVIGDLLRLNHNRVSERLPPSMHTLYTKLGVLRVPHYILHVCEDCTGYVYPVEKPEQETCKGLRADGSTCGAQRYHDGTRRPRFWCIHFPVDVLLQTMFADPDVVDEVDTTYPKSAADVDGLKDDSPWKGEAFLRLLKPPVHDATADGFPGGIGEERVFGTACKIPMPLEVGADAFQPYAGKSYSMTLITVRRANTNPDVRNTKANSRIMTIVPGPRQPLNPRPYFMPFFNDLQAFEDAKGLKLKKIVRPDEQTGGAWDVVDVDLQPPFLLRIFADSIERIRLAQWLGTAANLACGYCRAHKVSLDGAAGKKVLAGYLRGVEHPLILCADGKTPRTLRFNDDLLKLTEAVRRALAKDVNLGIKTPYEAGCKGLSVPAELAHYTVAAELFLLPIAHLLLRGLVRDLLAYYVESKGGRSAKAKAAAAFAAAAAAAAVAAAAVDDGDDDDATANANSGLPFIADRATKQLLRARLLCLWVTSEFDVVPQDLVDHLPSFKMAELLHFVEALAPIVFRSVDGEVMAQELRDAWAQLRAAVLHYMRPPRPEVPWTREAAVKAANSLLKYAKFLEQHMPFMLTPNLHWACAHLLNQEYAHGPAALHAEWFVERSVQDAKNKLAASKGRVSHGIEKTLANAIILENALPLARVHNSARGAAAFKPVKVEGRRGTAQDRDGPNFDKGSNSKIKMIGAGARVRSSRVDAHVVLLQRLVSGLKDSTDDGDKALYEAWLDSADPSSLLIDSNLFAPDADAHAGAYTYDEARGPYYVGLVRIAPGRADADADANALMASLRSARAAGSRQNCFILVLEEWGSGARRRVARRVGIIRELLLVRHPSDANHDLRVAIVTYLGGGDGRASTVGKGAHALDELLQVQPPGVVAETVAVLLSDIRSKLVVSWADNEPGPRYFQTFCNVSKLD